MDGCLIRGALDGSAFEGLEGLEGLGLYDRSFLVGESGSGMRSALSGVFFVRGGFAERVLLEPMSIRFGCMHWVGLLLSFFFPFLSSSRSCLCLRRRFVAWAWHGMAFIAIRNSPIEILFEHFPHPPSLRPLPFCASYMCVCLLRCGLVWCGWHPKRRYRLEPYLSRQSEASPYFVGRPSKCS